MIFHVTMATSEPVKHRKKLLLLKNPPISELQQVPTVSPRQSPHVTAPNNLLINDSNNSSSLLNKNKSPKKDKFNSPAIDCNIAHSIETLIQVPSQHTPSATKNGVYFISDLRDVPQIFFLATPKSWPTQISFFTEGISSYQLSPNGEMALLTSQEGGDEQYDLYLLDKGQIRPLIVDRTKRIESNLWGPNSDWFLYTSNQRNKLDMDLYRWDLKSNTPELLIALEGNHVLTDVSPDGKWATITRFRSVTDSDVLLFNLKTKQLLNATGHEGQVAAKEGHFSNDSKGLFFISDKGSTKSQVFFSSISDLNTQKLFTTGTDEVEDLLLDPSRHRFLITKNHEGYSLIEGVIIDDSGQRKSVLGLPELSRSVIKGISFSTSKSDPSLFFAFSNSLYPSHVFSWKNNVITQWTESALELLNPNCLTREELVHYPAADGKQIPAFLYYPTSKEPATPRKPIPFLVYIHGGPESQFRPSFSKIFQYFLERGYGIFAPNVRGSTGYGRDYSLLDNYKLRMDSVRDALDGTQWLLKERYAQKDQLGLFGGSYGGFMVLSMIENSPDLFTAASESVGITNFITFLQNTKPYRRALREIEYGPLTDETFLKSISPITNIDKIKTPLLIFHGANDPRVPVSETEQMVAELKKREIPVEIKIFSDEGHGNIKLKNILEQARWMVNFFEKSFTSKKKEGVSSF